MNPPDLIGPKSESVSILIVDDRPENRLALQAVLRDPGYEIVQVESAYEALALAPTREFAVVLTDVMMPDMDGIELTRRLRRVPLARETLVILMTAAMPEQEREHAGYAAGAVDFLYKPFDPLVVRAKVGVFAELFRHKRRLRASEEMRRLVLERANEAFIAIDSAGVVTEWNPQAEQTFGWSRSEAVDRVLAALIIPGRFRDAHRAGIERYLATGSGPLLDRRFEIFACRRDGREIPIEMTISSVHAGGRVTFNALLHDVSAKKRVEGLRDMQLRLTTSWPIRSRSRS